MLFIIMHKAPATQPDGPPDPELVAKMGALVGGVASEGRLHSAAGLKGDSSARVRVQSRQGKCTRTPGPYPGNNELIDRFAMLTVKDLDEGATWAERVASALGDAEIEVGPVTEAWDIGIGQKPHGVVPLRCLAVVKADARSETGAPLAPERAAKLEQTFEEMKRAGVYIADEVLAPSSTATRIRVSQGKRSVTDGPFAESKEFIGGFTIIHASSKADALAWADRYIEILGDIEVDVREVVERA